MTQFISFGSGSSGNCYYLLADGCGLIIDVGIGPRNFKKYFRDYGLSFGAIKAILVTHDHTDHVKGVGFMSGEFRVPVYAFESVHSGMQRNYFMSKKVAEERKNTTYPDKTFSIGPFTITPFAVPHDASANAGYFITTPDTTFCLITDAGTFTDGMASYVEQAEYLVIEANYDPSMLESGPYPAFLKRRIISEHGHAANADTGRFLAEHLSRKVKHVWLCHLSEENNRPDICLHTVREIVASAPQLGEDIAQHIETLQRRTPSLLFDLK